MIEGNLKCVTVFAPATVANVAVGFDILGFAIESLGDRVTVTRIEKREVVIEKIEGLEGLTHSPSENTATAPLLKMIEEQQLPFGFSVSIKKGIPLGSGLGGSASSAVAATRAAARLIENACLPKLSDQKLIEYALVGEAVASGARHGDNVVPCLVGGLQLIRSVDPVDYISLPFPSQILSVVIHPHLRLDTRESRKILPTEFKLKDIVQQTANLGPFIAGLYRNDLPLIKRSFFDVLIEPHRAKLIPSFYDVKAAALQAGAIGFSISGSGPSVFAWADSPASAKAIEAAAVQAFRRAGINADSWISPISRTGAKYE